MVKAQERKMEMATVRTHVSLSRRPIKNQAWKALQAHYKEVRNVDLRELFADDPKRGERLSTRFCTYLSSISKIALQGMEHHYLIQSVHELRRELPSRRFFRTFSRFSFHRCLT